MDKPREFVTEDQLSEERKLRQQEWERVRRSDQPKGEIVFVEFTIVYNLIQIEAPEPEIDCRPLYVRLQEQREKSQMEFEESVRLKHSIRGLDEEEVGFLHLIDCVREREQKKIKSEEDELIEEVRKKQSELTDESPVKLNLTEPSTTKVTEKKPKPVNKQAKLLLKAIKRKRYCLLTNRRLNHNLQKLQKNAEDENGGLERFIVPCFSLIASFNSTNEIAMMNICIWCNVYADQWIVVVDETMLEEMEYLLTILFVKCAIVKSYVRVKMTDDKQVSANSDNDDEGEMVVHRADEDTELKRFDAKCEDGERNGRKRHQQPDLEKTDTDDGENEAKKYRSSAESNQQAKGSEHSDTVQHLDSTSTSSRSNSSYDSDSSSGAEILSCFLQNATWKHRRVFRRRE
ncbi:hypothetical protein D917_07898 [Trichinella nativa]|uniref:FAM192A/Fyv6 N-terminal domain-containing protein n=1 Tax=Trichinella nativa TaxID=6335 RepID=A0A1Y3EM64_9BILA|nr:hypothetical protein D917_07898 [Trichinella nativa]